jgi:hypothetical protein
MKNKILTLFLMLTLASLNSCKDDEVIDKVNLKSNTLESNIADGSEHQLSQADAQKSFAILNWEAVDFGSSKEVKYSIEMALQGNNFTGAVDVATVINLSATITVEQFNIAAAGLGISPGEKKGLELRIRSWVDYLTDPGLSNSIGFSITPYQAVFPPIFLIGDAYKGWSMEPDVPADQSSALMFTSNTPGVYKTTAQLKGGNFRFLDFAHWTNNTTQWGFGFFSGGVPSEMVGAGDGDDNFTFVGTPGNYNITVSLVDKKISLEVASALLPETLYLVPSQLIDLDDALALPSIEPGVYRATVVVAQNTKFRIFTGKEWSAEKWTWSYFNEDAIDADLANSGDDAGNFIFVSNASEYYTITVSVNDKSITVDPASPPFPETLLINGDAQGWNFANAAILRSTATGVYEGMAKFDGVFRFFSTNDWVQPQWGYNYFTTIPGVFTDGGGGDSNIDYNGTARYYKITVSLVNKTIAVSDPVLYIVGDDQAWNLANAFPLTWQSGGTFSGTTTVTNNSIFRFFVTPAWSLPGNEYNFSSFTTVDSDFTNAGGGDQNLRFNGTTGSHTVTVDLINSSVVIN